MFKKRTSGFSLIEFVVTTTILTILSMLTSIAVHHLKETNRNAKRVTDIAEIQVALEMYNRLENEYPASIIPGQQLMAGTIVVAYELPSNPMPWDDGDCVGEEYTYKPMSNQTSYEIAFCLGARTGDIGPGENTARPGEIISCVPNCVKSCDFGNDLCGGTCLNILPECAVDEICSNDHCVINLE